LSINQTDRYRKKGASVVFFFREACAAAVSALARNFSVKQWSGEESGESECKE